MPHISCRVFSQNMRSSRGLSPLQPRFGTLWLLAFPKTKITFKKGRDFRPFMYSGKYNETADRNWENCVRFQGAYFEGDWGIMCCVQCFLYLVSSSINISIFHITWLDTLWTGLVYPESDYFLQCHCFCPDPSHHHFLHPPPLKYSHHSNRVVCYVSRMFSTDLILSAHHMVGARIHFYMNWEIPPTSVKLWLLHAFFFQ